MGSQPVKGLMALFSAQPGWTDWDFDSIAQRGLCGNEWFHWVVDQFEFFRLLNR